MEITINVLHGRSNATCPCPPSSDVSRPRASSVLFFGVSADASPSSQALLLGGVAGEQGRGDGVEESLLRGLRYFETAAALMLRSLAPPATLIMDYFALMALRR